MDYNDLTIKLNTLKKISDFHDQCSGCGLCTDYCSFHVHNEVNPKIHAANLLENHHKLPVLNQSYDCTACGYCQNKCPQKIDYKQIHVNIKENIYDTHGKLPSPSAERVVDFHQNNMFNKFFNHSTTGFTHKDDRKVFFPGCALIGFQPETVMATYEYLQKQDDNIGLMSYCCGKPTQTVGKIEAFNEKFETIIHEIKKHNITEFITACPNCYITLKNNLPHVKVTHISQALLTYGMPNNHLFHTTTTVSRVTIHDPCPMRNELEIHSAVRKLLDQLGFDIRERDNTMEHTLCCGSGAMLKVLSPEAAQKYTQVFLNDFQEDEAVITYCQECVETINESDKSAHHLLNIIFSPNYDMKIKTKDVSFIKKWANRYVYKTKVQFRI